MDGGRLLAVCMYVLDRIIVCSSQRQVGVPVRRSCSSSGCSSTDGSQDGDQAGAAALGRLLQQDQAQQT
jgi:hypothetical protein